MSVQYMRGLTILQAATAYTNGDRGYAAYLSDQVHDCLKNVKLYFALVCWDDCSYYLSFKTNAFSIPLYIVFVLKCGDVIQV